VAKTAAVDAAVGKIPFASSSPLSGQVTKSPAGIKSRPSGAIPSDQELLLDPNMDRVILRSLWHDKGPYVAGRYETSRRDPLDFLTGFVLYTAL